MDAPGSYAQFCPVAMAAEILCTRWTPLIVRELIAGSTRFNDLRRGVPRMSPALLSKRLRELEHAGIVERFEGRGSNAQEYRLTPAGLDLRTIVDGLGVWGQHWVEAQVSLKHLDPSLLMWDMRRNLDTTPMPAQRCTIQFLYPELPAARQNWWLVIEPSHLRGPVRETDLCASDPGFDVDLYVETDLRTMTAIWMGFTTVADELRSDRLRITGERGLRDSMQHWLGLSPFAKGKPPPASR
ncbi:MAG: helix-turn-helix domain-containing protein [Acetobacteraceae bacterium]